MHRYFDSILCIVTCIFNMVLLRHGETEWNRQGRLQGSGDSPLTARGVKQASASGQRLRHRNFVAAYCSPMLRAKRTATLVLDELEAAPELVDEPRLRERCFGVWEGLQWSTIEAEHAESLKRAQSEPDYAIPGGGESRQETLERALGFLSSLTERHTLPATTTSCWSRTRARRRR